MDDFEKNYPDFDWKHTPTDEHPQGMNCPCPRHEYIREQAMAAKQTGQGMTTKLCPDHYQTYVKEIYPKLPLWIRVLSRIFTAIGLIRIKKLTYMQSDQCYYCRFGTGGRERKSELPPQ